MSEKGKTVTQWCRQDEQGIRDKAFQKCISQALHRKVDGFVYYVSFLIVSRVTLSR